MTAPSTPLAACVNVSHRLRDAALARPQQIAIAEPARRHVRGRGDYRTVSFEEMERDVRRIAAGLLAAGASRDMRLALMVTPGIDFITLVFAMLRAGVPMVLIDPGMGRRNIFRCLDEVQVDGFVAVPPVHAVRTLLRRRFARARFNVTVGKRWFWRGPTLDDVRRLGADEAEPTPTAADDPAAIIFTTGSTGPPKGVLYTHRVFDEQVRQIQQQYAIAPGGVDVPGFPLFGLFNAAMGVTTVLPQMDFTRPARVDPVKFVQTINDWSVTQSFGSPALWNVVGRYCERHRVQLPTLVQIFSAGAPVPPDVLQRMTEAMGPSAQMHTPYGATESLPVATIAAAEVLGETAARSRDGAGTCVGRRFADVDWKIIRIHDGPIAKLEDAEELPRGEIGELVVRGAVVTRKYVTRTEANALHKIVDGDTFWHRMGDVGYFDDQQRFWMCGRKSHRVTTPDQTLYPVPCEAIINQHPAVFRSALVGVGPPGQQAPVLIVELEADARSPRGKPGEQPMREEILDLAAKHSLTRPIKHVMFHPAFPVDIRHNAKIFREKLAVWAADRLREGR
ncbi:MAG: AMP-binding protein [Planctomycetales bacterium]|nr:AMP-binding protein [Planctomycetales bacterium]